MKFKTLLIAMLLCGASAGYAQTDSKLVFGPYDEIEEYGDNYDDFGYYGQSGRTGGANIMCPMNFYFVNSGSQIIYYKDELKDMAGKNIKSIGFRYYDAGSYAEFNKRVRVYITETDKEVFDTKKIDNSKRYKFFDTRLAKPVYEGDLYVDGYNYSYVNGPEVKFVFNTPYYYSGKNNLVVTIVADGLDDVTTLGAEYINFFLVDGGMEKRAISYNNDRTSFSDILSANDYIKSTSLGLDLEAPVSMIEYADADSPEAWWNTYITTDDVDFSAVEGVKAYAVADNGSSVELREISSAPANTPVLLCQTVCPSFTSGGSGAKVMNNSLKASDGTVTGDGTIYVLAKSGSSYGFRRLKSGVKIPEGKAYLQTSANAKAFISIDEETTDIARTEKYAEGNDAEVGMYNLAGQKVKDTYKGIIIKNGKKYIK